MMRLAVGLERAGRDLCEGAQQLCRGSSSSPPRPFNGNSILAKHIRKQASRPHGACSLPRMLQGCAVAAVQEGQLAFQEGLLLHQNDSTACLMTSFLVPTRVPF